MRICHIVTGFKGGPEVIVRQLVTSQIDAGHAVTVIFTPLRDDPEEVRKALPPETSLQPWVIGREVSPADIKSFRELEDILSSLRPDVVHMHNSKAGIGRIVCRRLGIPHLYSPHGLSFLRKDVGPAQRAFFFLTEYVLAALGDLTVASSPGEMAAIRKFPGRKTLQVNGLDGAEIRAAAAGAIDPPKKNGTFRIVLVGRLEAQKNPAFVSELAAQCPADWEWLWVGDGALRVAAEASGRVQVLGWRERPAVLATVSSADVFLQASLWEGMSYALLEAMSLGKPCVVSTAPGNRDVVVDGVSGFVCGELGQYRARLTELSEDPVMRERQGSASADLIQSTYDRDTVLGLWASIYDGVVQPKGGR